ncbi:MAG: hypothetical protein U0M61_02500 [Succinivibrio sp.]|nr:hypothetical protein [Succinivibrio sp.]
MDHKKFSALLVLIIPKVVDLIVKNYHYDEIRAINEFYSSYVYSVLEQEDTKLWHLSPLTLFNLFDEEKTTGKVTFPEEN